MDYRNQSLGALAIAIPRILGICLDKRFETSPSEKATAFIKAYAQYPMKSEGTDNIGFAVYKIDLSSK